MKASTTLLGLASCAALLTGTVANAAVTGVLGGPIGPFSSLSTLGLDGGATATLIGGTVYTNDMPFADIPEGVYESKFLAAGPSSGQPATLTFNIGVDALSFLWGSPDTYNRLTIVSSTGSYAFDVNNLNFAVKNGDQSFSQYVSFFTTGVGETISSASFNNNPSTDAFEVANFSVAAVPEPATWAMMIIGFAGIGAALRTRRLQQSTSA